MVAIQKQSIPYAEWKVKPCILNMANPPGPDDPLFHDIRPNQLPIVPITSLVCSKEQGPGVEGVVQTPPETAWGCGGMDFKTAQNPGIDFYSGFRNKLSRGGGGGEKRNPTKNPV